MPVRHINSQCSRVWFKIIPFPGQYHLLHYYYFVKLTFRLAFYVEVYQHVIPQSRSLKPVGEICQSRLFLWTEYLIINFVHYHVFVLQELLLCWDQKGYLVLWKFNWSCCNAAILLASIWLIFKALKAHESCPNPLFTLCKEVFAGQTCWPPSPQLKAGTAGLLWTQGLTWQNHTVKVRWIHLSAQSGSSRCINPWLQKPHLPTNFIWLPSFFKMPVLSCSILTSRPARFFVFFSSDHTGITCQLCFQDWMHSEDWQVFVMQVL